MFIKDIECHIICFQSAGYYYYGEYVIKKEFKGLESFTEFLKSIDVYSIRTELLEMVKNKKIPEMIKVDRKIIRGLFTDNLLSSLENKELIKLILKDEGCRKSFLYHFLRNPHCPKEYLKEVSKRKLVPKDLEVCALLSNENLPKKVINKFTPEVMNIFHPAYDKNLLEGENSYKYKFRKALKQLPDRYTKILCPDCKDVFNVRDLNLFKRCPNCRDVINKELKDV